MAIVALPLSMAIAIASHTSPASGLFTAIVGGLLISALGGSRYQIGGPAGAFIVLVATIVDTHGIEGLLLATLMSGVIMVVMGVFRIGSFVRLVPHPVIVGFSSAIAVIIFASQLKETFGIQLQGAEPAAIVAKLHALWNASHTINSGAFFVAALSVTAIVSLRMWKPRWPGFLIAVVAGSAAATALNLEIATIGSRFGGIPNTLPWPSIPPFSLEKLLILLPSAISLALLGSIESLLSAVVADNMKGRKHRSNAELLAQGVANIATPLFGGIPATGTIARTATNVRSGAHGPVSGILHAIFLLLFMVAAAPLAAHIPLAVLAGILVVVSWNMFEKSAFASLLGNIPNALVLLATLLVTLFHDLLWGIIVGCLLSYFTTFFARSSDIRKT